MLHLVHNLSPSESLQSLVHTGLGISSIFPPCSPSFCPFALHVSLADSYHASLVWSCLSARAIHSGFAHHITQASFEVHAEQWLWNLDPHEVTWASTMCLILQFRSIKYSCTFLISWFFALRVRDRSTERSKEALVSWVAGPFGSCIKVCPGARHSRGPL